MSSVAFILAVVALLLLQTHAAVYYVQPSGSGSAPCTSQSSACKFSTLVSAIKDKKITLAPGDVIQLKGGAYGTASLSGWTVAENKDPVRVLAVGDVVFSQITVTGFRNIEFDGIRVLNSPSSLHCFKVYGNRYVTLKNVKLEKCAGAGVYVQNSPFTKILKSQIRDTYHQCIKAIKSSDEIYRSNTAGSQEGVVIEDNLMESCGADGLLISSQDAVIRRNRISKSGVHHFFPPTHGIYCKSDNALLEYNVIDDSVFNGITIRNTAWVRNNIVWGVGILRDQAQTDRRGSCYMFYNDGPRDGGLVAFENNVCYGAGPNSNAGGITVTASDGHNSTDGKGYVFLIQNNTIHYKGAGIHIERANLAFSYVINNVVTLIDSPRRSIINQSGKVHVLNNYEKANVGSNPTNIFVNPAKGDYRLVQSVNNSFKRVQTATVQYAYGRHSAILALPKDVQKTGDPSVVTQAK